MTSSPQGVCLSLVILSRRRRIHTLNLWILRCAQYDRVGQKPSAAFSSKKGDTPKAQKVSENPKNHIPQTKIQKFSVSLLKQRVKAEPPPFYLKKRQAKSPKAKKNSESKSQKGKPKSSRQSHKSRPTKSQLHTQKP